jgi:hypothetical protein
MFYFSDYKSQLVGVGVRKGKAVTRLIGGADLAIILSLT